jgi:hypothetical protein
MQSNGAAGTALHAIAWATGCFAVIVATQFIPLGFTVLAVGLVWVSTHRLLDFPPDEAGPGVFEAERGLRTLELFANRMGK